MTSDPSAPSTVPTISPSPPTTKDCHQQVRFNTKEDKLLLHLPPETELGNNWQDISQQLQQLIHAGERFWQNQTEVQIVARERLLDTRQLQAIAEILSQVQLKIKSVATTRRQTAVAAATAGYSVEQQSYQISLNPHPKPPIPPLADPLYLETTVRSGVEIRHGGTVVILGDLNPGGAVVAQGDILVWGRLRGVVHAGADGNSKCRIMALQMEPTQIRIADYAGPFPRKTTSSVLSGNSLRYSGRNSHRQNY